MVMTDTAVADVTWVPDHAPMSEVHTSPVQEDPEVHSPPVQEEADAPTPRVPVDSAAAAVFLNITRRFSDVGDPVERYELLVYWRAVLEQAAMEMTVHTGYALADLQESGLSSRKISALLAEAGHTLSASGVEQAIKRTRGAS